VLFCIHYNVYTRGLYVIDDVKMQYLQYLFPFMIDLIQNLKFLQSCMNTYVISETVAVKFLLLKLPSLQRL